MKVLKKQGLTLFLIAALIVTLTLGIVFMMPARTASAEEEFTPDVTVNSARALKEAVQNAYSSGDTPYKIQLGADIVLGEEGDSDTNGLFTYAKNLIIDLNGHAMKHQYGSWIFCVANIDAKLELIDTSEGKTGVITNDVPNSILIYNYGTLISSVNMTNKTNQAAIMSTPNGLKASDVDNAQVWAKKPSVTIKNGTFIGGSYGEFINLVDSNLTIENGTFLRETDSSSDRSIFKTGTYSWESKEVNQERYWFADEHKPELRRQVKEKIGNILDAYAPYRGSEVLIKGGNFVGSQGRPENISLGSKISCNIPCGNDGEWGSYMGLLEMEETFESKVTIEGGYWSIDYSIYCPNNQWMRKYDPKGDPAGGPEGDYYIVDTIDEDIAVASVTAENINKSFSNFEAAWAYAKSVSGDRTVTVKQDATIEQMNLDIDLSTQAKDGTITLDLNGHKLTHTEYNKSAIVLNRMSALTLIIKDGSEDQTGELNFVLPSGNSPSTGRIDITNLNAKFVLESGTLRQTGYLPNEDTYKDPTANGNGSQARAASIFHIEPSVSYGRDDDQRALQIAALEALEEPVVTIKGGNILSEICFGTAEEHEGPTASKILVSWLDGHHYQSNFNFRQPENNYTVSNKADKFQFDISAYIAAGHTSTFSWNFKDTESDDWKTLTAFDDLNCVADNGRYIFANVKEDDKYYVNGTGYADITKAIEAAQPNGAITLLRDVTITEAIELDGITLDLDVNRHYTLTIGEGGSLTLKNNAVLCNGTVEGDITVEGNVTMRSATVTGTAEPIATVTVQNGTLTIPSGEYNCTFDVVGDAKIDITGGSFRGDQVTNLENYFSIPFYYAYNGTDGHYDDSTLYPVKIAPNPDAQKWYNRYKDSGKFEIASTDEWNYFAIYVSSGADSFEGKTVTLIDNLDFGYRPSVNGASAASEPLLFLPAGTQGIPRHSYGFRGTFDGEGNTIKGINVTEINAGLFGRTDGSAKISNITVANSVFTGGRGVGYFDEYNTEKGWVFAGGVIAQGYHGNNVDNPAKNITVQNVTIAQAPNSGNIMAGGYIGQTWNDLCLEDINIDKVTLQGNWKMGGIVGFTEASVTIKNGSVTELDTSGCSSNYVGSVMGQLVGQSLTLDSCDVDAPDDYLVGGMDAGHANKEFKIQGVGTDIAAKGSTKMTNSFLHGAHNSGLELTVPTTEEESEQEGGFSVNFGEEEIPSDAYKNDDGEVVVAMVYSNGNIVRYETLEEALKGAKEGDTVVLNSDVEESVTISTGMGITLDLGGHTLTGTITVEGALTLENGTVKGTVTNNGKLILELSEDQTLTIEGSGDDGKAIEGTYEVGENVCKTSDDGHKIEFVYGHGETIYSADGNVITLTCDVCHQVLGTVTLVAPENVTYSGEKIEATVDVSEGLDLDETLTITYKNEAGEEVQEIISVGTYTASITLGGVTASVTFTVKQMELVISDIQGTITYSGEGEPTIEVSSYTLKDLAGNVVQLDGVTVTVTLQKSKYNVGKQVALITAINMTGNSNYALAVAGNEAFIELDVAAANLIVRVNRDGSVSYEGFVNGENESVLEGELHLEWVDNGDGTSTVTPSGLTSANYVITFESGIVENEQSSSALWITLAIVGGVIAALGAAAVVYAFRRKKN